MNISFVCVTVYECVLLDLNATIVHISDCLICPLNCCLFCLSVCLGVFFLCLYLEFLEN